MIMRTKVIPYKKAIKKKGVYRSCIAAAFVAHRERIRRPLPPNLFEGVYYFFRIQHQIGTYQLSMSAKIDSRNNKLVNMQFLRHMGLTPVRKKPRYEICIIEFSE